MSIVWVKDWLLEKTQPSEGFVSIEQEMAVVYPVMDCAFCGEPLWRNDFVFWMGAQSLGFHPGCAEHMARGLLLDCGGIMTSGRPYDRGYDREATRFTNRMPPCDSNED